MKQFSETRKYKRGQKLQLDEIYEIQGICGGDWWRRSNPDNDMDENIVISRSIVITITWKSSK